MKRSQALMAESDGRINRNLTCWLQVTVTRSRREFKSINLSMVSMFTVFMIRYGWLRMIIMTIDVWPGYVMLTGNIRLDMLSLA